MCDQKKYDFMGGGVHVINEAVVSQSVTIKVGLTSKFLGCDGKGVAPNKFHNGFKFCQSLFWQFLGVFNKPGFVR